MPVRKPTAIPKPLLMRLEDKIPKLVTVLKNSRSRIRSASAGRDRKSGNKNILCCKSSGCYIFENPKRPPGSLLGTPLWKSPKSCRRNLPHLWNGWKCWRMQRSYHDSWILHQRFPKPYRMAPFEMELWADSPTSASKFTCLGSSEIVSFKGTHCFWWI